MEKQQNNVDAGDNNVKLENDIEIIEELPNYSTRENILDFEEESVYFIKPERNHPVKTKADVKLKLEVGQLNYGNQDNVMVKLENDIEFNEELPEYSTRENILDFEEEAVCFVKPKRCDLLESEEGEEECIKEMKEVKVLLTTFIYRISRENVVDFEREFLKPDRSDHLESDSVEEEIKDMKEVNVLITKFDKFTCVVCDRNLDRNGPMRVWKYFEGRVQFLCDDCRGPKGEKFICVKCNHGFVARQRLIDHVDGVHRKLKKYKCDECNRAFTQFRSLKTHVQSVHRKLKHACQQCKKVFSNRGTLFRHVNFTHRQMNIFTCDSCNKEFPNQRNFEQHIDIVHHKIKEFECEECKHVFSVKQNLKQHVNSVHRKLKPFACDKCNHSFARRHQLRNHIDGVHLKVMYTCAKCNKAYTQKCNLIKHILVNHRKIKPFVCSK